MSVLIQTYSGSDMCVQLSNGAFVRPVVIPASATLVRVGVRMNSPSTTNIAGTPRFALGLSKGTTNILGDATTDFFVGAITTLAFTYNAGASSLGHYTRAAAASREGSTLATSANFNFSANPDILFPVTNQGVWFVDIAVKNATTATIKLFADIFNENITAARFFANMSQTAPVITDHLMCDAALDVAATTANMWNNRSVTAWWNQSTWGMRLPDIAVAVLA